MEHQGAPRIIGAGEGAPGLDGAQLDARDRSVAGARRCPRAGSARARGPAGCVLGPRAMGPAQRGPARGACQNSTAMVRSPRAPASAGRAARGGPVRSPRVLARERVVLRLAGSVTSKPTSGSSSSCAARQPPRWRGGPAHGGRAGEAEPGLAGHLLERRRREGDPSRARAHDVRACGRARHERGGGSAFVHRLDDEVGARGERGLDVVGQEPAVARGRPSSSSSGTRIETTSKRSGAAESWAKTRVPTSPAEERDAQRLRRLGRRSFDGRVGVHSRAAGARDVSGPDDVEGEAVITREADRAALEDGVPERERLVEGHAGESPRAPIGGHPRGGVRGVETLDVLHEGHGRLEVTTEDDRGQIRAAAPAGLAPASPRPRRTRGSRPRTLPRAGLAGTPRRRPRDRPSRGDERAVPMDLGADGGHPRPVEGRGEQVRGLDLARGESAARTRSEEGAARSASMRASLCSSWSVRPWKALVTATTRSPRRTRA